MNKKVFCLECKMYFDNYESYKATHEKASFKVMKIQHTPLLEDACLSYISNILLDNVKIKERIREQDAQIKQIESKLNYYEDALKNDVSFECNINIENTENIDGKCLLHFFPKCVNFRIDCKGVIDLKGKKEFNIEILFPFKNVNLKFSSIEKLQGCVLIQKVLNLSEQETTIFNNYSSFISQKNYITSIKLLRNYFIAGCFEQKKFDVSINGILTFTNFKYNLSSPFVLYNITQKKYICYNNYQWKFIDNCFENDGSISKACIIDLELDQNSSIYIKNQFKYLGNKNDFVATDKENAQYKYKFYNKFYGILTIFNNERFLSADPDTGLVKLSEEENYFIIYNV